MTTYLPLAFFIAGVAAIAICIKLYTSRRIERAREHYAAALAFAAQLDDDCAHFCRLFDAGRMRQIDQDFPDFAEFRHQRAVWQGDE